MREVNPGYKEIDFMTIKESDIGLKRQELVPEGLQGNGHEKKGAGGFPCPLKPWIGVFQLC